MNNWQGLIVFFLIVGVPALKQVADYLHRKKEARQIDKERSRREYDALRTGSVVRSASSASSAQTRPASQYTQSRQVNAAEQLREIQAKRREALERARRHASAGVDIAISVATTGQPPITRQSSSARLSPAARSTPTARSAPGARPMPSGPRPTRGPPRQSAPGPLIGGRAPLPSQQAARAPTPRQPAKPKPRAVLPTTPPLEPLHTRAVKRQRAKQAKLGAHSDAHKLLVEHEYGTIIEQSHAAISPGEIARMSPSEWRSAIVLQEVLSRPIALRDEQ